MTANALTIEHSFVVDRRRHGPAGPTGEPARPPAPARVPRIARLLALALRFEELLRQGRLCDYAEIARLGHVSRARVTQIMNLLLLAPDIQEGILFLPRVERGRDPIHLRQLQAIALVPAWPQQRRLWAALSARALEGAVTPIVEEHPGIGLRLVPGREKCPEPGERGGRAACSKNPWRSDPMAASKHPKATKAKKAAARPDAAAEAPPTGKRRPRKIEGGKQSAVGAAARVLEENGQPMSCPELIEAMAAKGYWKSPAGKTPSATLYASLAREIKLRGKEARFQKAGPGKFARA